MRLGVAYLVVRAAQLAELVLAGEPPSLLQASLQAVSLVALPPGVEDPSGLPFPLEGAGEGHQAYRLK